MLIWSRCLYGVTLEAGLSANQLGGRVESCSVLVDGGRRSISWEPAKPTNNLPPAHSSFNDSSALLRLLSTPIYLSSQQLANRVLPCLDFPNTLKRAFHKLPWTSEPSSKKQWVSFKSSLSNKVYMLLIGRRFEELCQGHLSESQFKETVFWAQGNMRCMILK